jgi:competence protein ComEC
VANLVCLPEKTLTKLTLFITPSQIAILCTIPVLVAYAYISGMSTPTVRSLIMVFIYMLAMLLGRKGEWMNSLSIAAIIILIYKPAALFELSFMLSFIAVFSIGYVLEQRSDNLEKGEPVPPFTKEEGGWITKIYEKLKISFFLTTAAVLGTAPLSIAVFHQFPVIAPLANLIVTPLVCFAVLPLGFVSGFAALFFDMQIMPFNSITDTIAGFALLLVKFFSNIPYASIRIHSPSIFLIVAYYLSLIILFKNKSIWRTIPVALVILLYIITPYLPGHDLRITFLDVGQGDASVVEFPDNTVMLIDGGSEDAGAGQRAVAPSLWSRGIRNIDYLVVSHPHPDHFGGLYYILDNFEIGEVWATMNSAYTAREFFDSVAAKGITVRTPVRGDVISATGYRIYVLHPYDEFSAGSPRGDFSDENSSSMVLKIESEGTSILFTGDIEDEAEGNVLDLGKWLKSDIIKVPHHGGRTSSSTGFLKAVNPDIAVVSAGKNNPFHHPHQKTLERYKGEGVKLLRTDRDGAITINGRDGYYKVTTCQDSRFQKVKFLRDEIRNLRLLIF